MTFEIKEYALSPKLGTVAVLSEDVGGLTFVARWVRTDLLTDRTEYLIDELPDE